jgi:hypothetical protein
MTVVRRGSHTLRRYHRTTPVAVRSQLLLRAARTVARELRKDGGATLPASVGRLEPVPAKGTAGGVRLGRIVGFVVHYGLFLAIAASIVAFFVPALDRLGGTKTILELVVGAVMTIEGGLLVSNWHGARWRFVSRRVERSEARAGRPTGLFDALRWRLLGYALFAVGLAWIGLGVVMLGQGASDLF